MIFYILDDTPQGYTGIFLNIEPHFETNVDWFHILCVLNHYWDDFKSLQELTRTRQFYVKYLRKTRNSFKTESSRLSCDILLRTVDTSKNYFLTTSAAHAMNTLKRFSDFTFKLKLTILEIYLNRDKSLSFMSVEPLRLSYRFWCMYVLHREQSHMWELWSVLRGNRDFEAVKVIHQVF